METIKLVLPPFLEIEIPGDYPIPLVGGDFYLNYENFASATAWERIRGILEDNVLVVKKVEEDTVYLHEGSVPGIAVDLDVNRAELEAYWQEHPVTNPATEPYSRVYVAYDAMDVPVAIPPEHGHEQSTITALRILGIFDTMDDYLNFEEDYMQVDREYGPDVTEYPCVPSAGYGDEMNDYFRDLMDEYAMDKGVSEPYLVIVDPKTVTVLSVERTDRTPWDGSVPERADPELEVRYQNDGPVRVWCLARSRNDACKLAFFPCYIDHIEDF